MGDKGSKYGAKDVKKYYSKFDVVMFGQTGLISKPYNRGKVRRGVLHQVV
jgi:hypothetical protein